MIDLKSISNVRTYDNAAKALRFLFGGIGTGNVSVTAGGEFCDFELFNIPDKGLKLPYSFFAMRCALDSGEQSAVVLETKPAGICDEPVGVAPGLVPGLPRFDRSVFSAAYPFAQVDFYKDDLPFEVSMQAFTPFIPLNDKDSGIPGVCITYRVKNVSGRQAYVSIAGTLPNACGYDGLSYDGRGKLYLKGKPHNEVIKGQDLQGIFYTTNLEKDVMNYGSMALMTDAKEGFSAKSCWLNEGWWDGAEEFWQDFTEDGELHEAVAGNKPLSRVNPSEEEMAIGSIAVTKSLKDGEEADFVFYFTWHFENRYGWWPNGHDMKNKPWNGKMYKTYYSVLWKDALDAAAYLNENKEKFEEISKKFADALYGSTLPLEVIEAAANNITVLRSPTCFRIADGSFFGWEGCFAHSGSCTGTCTHVWNYAQTLANLFPALERDCRETEFLQETDEEGCMMFRAERKLEGVPWDMYPAVDGQMGCILRAYREWKMSGDDEFLKKLWKKMVLALEYAEKHWDSDDDYVMDGVQHNTYDIEFYGTNSLGNSIYFAALKAGAEMAAYLGDQELCEKWTNGFQKGSEKMDQLLFNGEYFIQKIDGDVNEHKYQYGEGCLSDQLLGQTLAHLYGLGYVLPEEHVKSAVYSIYRYNFREKMGNHMSLQRGYAYQDEPGLLLCSWPKGGRPKQPFVYSDEVWTGIEYQVATNLIAEGYVEEGLNIVKAVRTRYDGYRRSPFNEVECGNHYARSMASWGVYNAFSGLQVDLPHGKVSISPKVNQDAFACFYATGKEWGICRQMSENGEMKQWFEPLYKAE